MEVKERLLKVVNEFDWMDALIGLVFFGLVAVMGKFAHYGLSAGVVALLSVAVGIASSDKDEKH